MTPNNIEALAGALASSDRQNTMAEFRESICSLKGDAVGRGRLRSGFFVQDVRRLCEQFLNRRAQEILDAYDSALAAAPQDFELPAEAILKMREQLTRDVQAIEQEFQSSLHRNHLAARSPMAEAFDRCNDVFTARGRIWVERYSRSSRSMPGLPLGAEPGVTTNAAITNENIFDVKPGFWGISVDLKALARRLRAWWKTVRSE